MIVKEEGKTHPERINLITGRDLFSSSNTQKYATTEVDRKYTPPSFHTLTGASPINYAVMSSPLDRFQESKNTRPELTYKTDVNTIESRGKRLNKKFIKRDREAPFGSTPPKRQQPTKPSKSRILNRISDRIYDSDGGRAATIARKQMKGEGLRCYPGLSDNSQRSRAAQRTAYVGGLGPGSYRAVDKVHEAITWSKGFEFKKLDRFPKERKHEAGLGPGVYEVTNPDLQRPRSSPAFTFPAKNRFDYRVEFEKTLESAITPSHDVAAWDKPCRIDGFLARMPTPRSTVSSDAVGIDSSKNITVEGALRTSSRRYAASFRSNVLRDQPVGAEAVRLSQPDLGPGTYTPGDVHPPNFGLLAFSNGKPARARGSDEHFQVLGDRWDTLRPRFSLPPGLRQSSTLSHSQVQQSHRSHHHHNNITGVTTKPKPGKATGADE